MSIELTEAQARAVAELAGREGRPVTLHQLAATGSAHEVAAVYATSRGTATGYQIAADGTVDPIGETLPAAG